MLKLVIVFLLILCRLTISNAPKKKKNIDEVALASHTPQRETTSGSQRRRWSILKRVSTSSICCSEGTVSTASLSFGVPRSTLQDQKLSHGCFLCFMARQPHATANVLMDSRRSNAAVMQQYLTCLMNDIWPYPGSIYECRREFNAFGPPSTRDNHKKRRR